MFKKFSLKTKLLVSFFGVGIIPFAVMAVIAVTKAESSLRKQAFAQMQSMRDAKKGQVEQYLQTIKNQALSFSENHMIIAAMSEFSEAFQAFSTDNGIASNDIDALRKQLATYYENEFSTAYGGQNDGRFPEAGAIVGQLNDHAVALQYHYIKANGYPLGLKHKLDRAQDRSRYSEIHARYHPTIRNFLERFGYYDIFLVRPDTGDIVYSVFKELDFATSLKNGPYARTNFGDAFRKANAAVLSDTVVFTDFKNYFPSYEAPAGFVASPIYKAGAKIGVLIFQFPLDTLNAIMKTWAGMGQSGETYLVGNDLLMRSNAYLGPDHHLAVASYKHPEKGKVDTQAVRDAMQGKTGESIITGYNGNLVLSAYTPLNFEGLKWALLAEIDAAEALMAVNALQWVAMVVSLVGVVGIVVVALLITRAITCPVQNIVANLTDLAHGECDLTERLQVDSQDEIGQLSKCFNEFMDKLWHPGGHCQHGQLH